MTDAVAAPEVLHTTTTVCRGCRSVGRMDPVFSLGDLHINAFPRPGEPDTPKAPLVLTQCQDCDLVQLSASVRKDALYRTYHYRSGVNQKIAGELHKLVAQARQFVDLRPGDAVLDIGSNDGTLLDAYDDQPHLHLFGVDPSDIAQEALRKTPPYRTILVDYWPLSRPVTPHACKIITSVAMLYDVDDLPAFASAVHDWLHPDGVWAIEVADLRAVLERNAFDTICHEHVSYFTAGTLTRLLWRYGFRVISMHQTPVNGGSLRIFAGRRRDKPGFEPHREFIDAADWLAFANRLQVLWAQTHLYLSTMRSSGHLVLGCGASTKGNTLLQYFEVTRDLLPAIGERQSHKVGLETVGTRIPIISEEEMRERQPVGLFVLPWHLGDVIAQREAWLTSSGGHIAMPLPRFATIGTAPPIPM